MARRPRRTFAAEFEAEVVLDLLAGQTTPAEVGRKHQLSPSPVALWKAALVERRPTVSQADDRHAADADRIAERERLVGQQALELSALKKVSPWAGGTPPTGGRSCPRCPGGTPSAGCVACSTAPERHGTADPQRLARGKKSGGRRSFDGPGGGPPTGTDGSPRCAAATGGRCAASGCGG